MTRDKASRHRQCQVSKDCLIYITWERRPKIILTLIMSHWSRRTVLRLEGETLRIPSIRTFFRTCHSTCPPFDLGQSQDANRSAASLLENEKRVKVKPLLETQAMPIRVHWDKHLTKGHQNTDLLWFFSISTAKQFRGLRLSGISDKKSAARFERISCKLCRFNCIARWDKAQPEQAEYSTIMSVLASFIGALGEECVETPSGVSLPMSREEHQSQSCYALRISICALIETVMLIIFIQFWSTWKEHVVMSASRDAIKHVRDALRNFI